MLHTLMKILRIRYMIDWKKVALGMLGRMDGKATSTYTYVAGKHNVRAVFLDSGFNMICTDLLSKRCCIRYKEKTCIEIKKKLIANCAVSEWVWYTSDDALHVSRSRLL